MPSVFFAFRDAPERRAALRTPNALDRYRLFGLEDFVARGACARHNLGRAASRWPRPAARVLNITLGAAGSLGGDFAAVLPSLGELNAADVVFSTVDTVGIPLLHLKRANLVRRPLVYTSIGLPERLEGIRNERSFKRALREARTVVTYAAVEAVRLREWIGAELPPVVFVPFGVDVEAFRPVDETAADFDVVSVGADPRRDFELLLAIAARRPELRFRIVATAERARSLVPLPTNVGIDTDVPLETVRDRFRQARVIALPVRENTYSGATTTLLQAMAIAKPVVVSRTDAIAEGYALEDGVNCRLVPPGDVGAFERALIDLVLDTSAAASIGERARATVTANFSWQRYVSRLWEIVVES